MFPQLLEDPPDGLFMFFDRVGEYEYIIQVYMYGSPDPFAKYSRHKSLERRGGIAVPLLHDTAEERAIHCRKSRLRDIFLDDSRLLVRVRHVQLRAISCSGDVMPDLFLVRERRYVLHGVVVPLPEVYDGA